MLSFRSHDCWLMSKVFIMFTPWWLWMRASNIIRKHAKRIQWGLEVNFYRMRDYCIYIWNSRKFTLSRNETRSDELKLCVSSNKYHPKRLKRKSKLGYRLEENLFKSKNKQQRITYIVNKLCLYNKIRLFMYK